MRTSFLVAVLVSWMCWTASGAQTWRPTKYSVEQVRQALSALNARFGAWYVEYQAATTTGRKSGRAVHRIIAARKPNRLLAWSAHETPEYLWSDDPLQQRLTINGALAIEEHPWNREFITLQWDPKQGLPGSASQEFLFVALGWWPFVDWTPPRLPGLGIVLPDLATSKSYVLLPAEDMVHDRWCNVLEFRGHDRVWIDMQRGGVITHRECIEPETGNVRQIIDSRDFWEAKPGIWIPKVIHNTLLDNGGAVQDGSGGEIVLQCVKLDADVPSSLFTFTPQPGAIEVHRDGHFEQRTSGGTDFLEHLIVWFQRRSRAAPHVRTPPFWRRWESVMEYSISSVALCVVVWTVRRQAGSSRLDNCGGRNAGEG